MGGGAVPGEMSGGEKLTVVGLASAAVIGVVILAHTVSRCRMGYWRWSRAINRGDLVVAEAFREKAQRQGCDWPSKVSE